MSNAFFKRRFRHSNDNGQGLRQGTCITRSEDECGDSDRAVFNAIRKGKERVLIVVVSSVLNFWRGRDLAQFSTPDGDLPPVDTTREARPTSSIVEKSKEIVAGEREEKHRPGGRRALTPHRPANRSSG